MTPILGSSRLPAVTAICLMILLILLLVCHLRADQAPACMDEMLMRWNEFARDANQHAQTLEANETRRDKTHRKLEREWEALEALACW